MSGPGSVAVAETRELGKGFGTPHPPVGEASKGYDTVLDEMGSNLPGGQRQRTTIARTLGINSRILILDEATAALDYGSERLFQRNPRAAARNRAVAIVAQHLLTIQGADWIFAMESGSVAESGAHESLVSGGGLYAVLAGP